MHCPCSPRRSRKEKEARSYDLLFKPAGSAAAAGAGSGGGGGKGGGRGGKGGAKKGGKGVADVRGEGAVIVVWVGGWVGGMRLCYYSLVFSSVVAGKRRTALLDSPAVVCVVRIDAPLSPPSNVLGGRRIPLSVIICAFPRFHFPLCFSSTDIAIGNIVDDMDGMGLGGTGDASASTAYEDSFM